jgi:predicted phage terminase large subunit-like protein
MRNGQYIILDVKRMAANAATVRSVVRNTAVADKAEYKASHIFIPQDPGQAGKEQAQSYVRELAGFRVSTHVVSGDKVTRAEPFAAQWQAGNVLLLEGAWNEMFLCEAEGFPDTVHDDQVDAASDAFKMVAANGMLSAPPSMPSHESYWQR